MINPLPKETCFNSLCINLTNRCNTLCKYCFQDSRPRNKDRISASDIERLLAHFNKTYPESGEKYLQLTGGEATLHSDIFEIIKIGLFYGYQIRLQTNGLTLSEMTDQQIRTFRSDKILIKISLDGWNAKTHEFLRARGSFDVTLRGIRRLSSIHGTFGIKTVIHEKNIIGIENMLPYCKELGAIGFSYNMLRQEGRGTKFINNISELDVVERLVPSFNQDRYRSLMNGSNILLYYLFQSNSALRQWMAPGMFYVDCDGGIFQDQDCNPDDRIGTIFGENLTQEFLVSRLVPKQIHFNPTIIDYVRNNLRIG